MCLAKLGQHWTAWELLLYLSPAVNSTKLSKYVEGIQNATGQIPPQTALMNIMSMLPGSDRQSIYRGEAIDPCACLNFKTVGFQTYSLSRTHANTYERRSLAGRC